MIDLSDNALSAESLAYIVEGIKYNSNVMTLNLS